MQLLDNLALSENVTAPPIPNCTLIMIFFACVVSVFWLFGGPPVSYMTFSFIDKKPKISILQYYLEFHENSVKN